MNANSRKWADRPLFWPIFMLFVVIPPFSALRGPLTAFRPRTSGFGPRPPLQPRCDSFSAQKTHFAAVFRSHRPPRGPFCEIGITWRPITDVKPISRALPSRPPVPYRNARVIIQVGAGASPSSKLQPVNNSAAIFRLPYWYGNGTRIAPPRIARSCRATTGVRLSGGDDASEIKRILQMQTPVKSLL